MQINAMSSALLGIRRAEALQDRSAEQVASLTASPVDGGGPPVDAEGDLVTAFVGLTTSDVLMKAGVAVARTARETYEAVLRLG